MGGRFRVGVSRPEVELSLDLAGGGRPAIHLAEEKETLLASEVSIRL